MVKIRSTRRYFSAQALKSQPQQCSASRSRPRQEWARARPPLAGNPSGRAATGVGFGTEPKKIWIQFSHTTSRDLGLIIQHRRDPHRGFEAKGRVLPYVRWKDSAPTPDLAAPLLAGHTWHRQHQNSPRVEEVAAGELGVVPSHQCVLAGQNYILCKVLLFRYIIHDSIDGPQIKDTSQTQVNETTDHKNATFLH
jgi:hypothetical protein